MWYRIIMSQIVKYVCKELGIAQVSCTLVGSVPWFKAKDVAQILKHTNTTKALKDHVDDEDRRKCDELAHNGPT